MKKYPLAIIIFFGFVFSESILAIDTLPEITVSAKAFTNEGDEFALAKPDLFTVPNSNPLTESEEKHSSVENPMPDNNYLIVDLGKGELTSLNEKGEVLFQTKVVLPRKDFYNVPIVGIVYDITGNPTWTPTQSMHKSNPGKYRDFYPPRTPGNAMGFCKASMDFTVSDGVIPGADSNQMQGIRIHGNGKEWDLGKHLSSGCIRIPDPICPSLVKNSIKGTYVYFVNSEKSLKSFFAKK